MQMEFLLQIFFFRSHLFFHASTEMCENTYVYSIHDSNVVICIQDTTFFVFVSQFMLNRAYGHVLFVSDNSNCS